MGDDRLTIVFMPESAYGPTNNCIGIGKVLEFAGEELRNMVLDAPNGEIKLDHNRQAIGTNFVTEVVEDADGNLVSQVVKVVENVNQTLGYDEETFRSIGLPGRDVPECKTTY